MQHLAIRVTEVEAAELDVGSVRFDVTGEHAGCWLLRLRPPRSVERVPEALVPPPADCIFRLDSADFVSLFAGKVSGQQLFFDGRLEVDGDLTTTLKLPTITRLVSSAATRLSS